MFSKETKVAKSTASYPIGLFPLGVKLRDKVSGFVGVGTSACTWLNGCVRYGLEPPVDKDGKWVDGRTIDQEQLELVVDPSVMDEPKRTHGGDRSPDLPSRF
jgi:hypothetical protein